MGRGMVSHDLDDKSEWILEALYNFGGEAETPEIKEFTGIDKGGSVHYRINDKLEPAGLVDVRKVGDDGDSMGVNVTTLTEEGKREAERILDEGDGPSLVERMERVEGDVEDLRDTVLSYEGHLDEAIESGEEFASLAREAEAALERVSALADDVEELRERVELVENQPFEEIAERKMAELRKVAARVEEVDQLNADVRSILRTHGIIQGTRVEATEEDLPESQHEWLRNMKNNPTRNTPRRDAFAPGPALEALPTGDGDGTAASAVDPTTFQKIQRLDDVGALDALIEAAEDGRIEIEGARSD